MENGLLACSLLQQNWRMRTIVWVVMLSKTSAQFDCIFVQGHMLKGNFHTVREKSFLQWEFISSRWITQIVRHSNETGDSTAGT